MDLSFENGLQFPSEIMVNILSRCGTYDLLAMKLVSKNWFFSIKHPYFVRIHTEMGHDRLNSSFLLGSHFVSAEEAYDRLIIVSSNADDEEILNYLQLHPLIEQNMSMDLLGTSNGLLFLKVTNDDGTVRLFICNPTTRRVRQIQDFVLPMPTGCPAKSIISMDSKNLSGKTTQPLTPSLNLSSTKRSRGHEAENEDNLKFSQRSALSDLTNGYQTHMPPHIGFTPLVLSPGGHYTYNMENYTPHHSGSVIFNDVTYSNTPVTRKRSCIGTSSQHHQKDDFNDEIGSPKIPTLVATDMSMNSMSPAMVPKEIHLSSTTPHVHPEIVHNGSPHSNKLNQEYVDIGLPTYEC
ncbi:F-box protein CPR30-like [Senna tora]|uniref:F-box protein CPR30-like n=1 Tax=Senna tora TaxID=362788 RepID=A0A834TP79_9FABA|nr:F-box protein CPR30-like [Senna tora]